MNLDELQSVQARERQSSDLQHLRSSFYREVGEYIQTLNEKRARTVESADDPFSEPEVKRLTDDIETAENTVEAIYERRVGKVVKKASIAAAGMSVEDDGLTREEASLFEDLVERIEENRETVLSVLDGDTPNVSCSIEEEVTESRTASADPKGGRADVQEPPESDISPESVNGSGADTGVNAADLMGDSETDSTAETPPPPTESASTPPPKPDSQQTVDRGEGDETPTVDVPPETATTTGDATPEAPPEQGQTSPERRDTESQDIPGLPRTTVRITADVGQIVGADDRDYDLGTEDVVTLPEPNANVLVEKNAAEPLE